MNDQQKQQLLEIASEMGVTINELLENKTPEMIIEEYNNKTFQILND